MSLSVTDFTIDNASGQAVRLDIEACFKALQGQNAETTDLNQSQCVAGMTFLNTTTNTLKVRNSANSGFTDIGNIDTANLGLLPVSGGTLTGVLSASTGSTSVPSLNFGDNSTGLFKDSSNSISISCSGATQYTFNQTNLDSKSNILIDKTNASADAALFFIADSTYNTTQPGFNIIRRQTNAGESQLIHRGIGRLHLYCQDAGHIAFTTQSVTRWRINDNGGFFWQEHTGGGAPPISGDVQARGYISRRGVAPNANVANPWNFYWDTNHLECWVDGTEVGNVSGPTSDYRIKTNVALQTESGIDKIKLLKPITYEIKDYGAFKADSEKREGFLAHEVQEAIPSGATGVKDGERIQSLRVDALISVLTKALQEAVAKIETLETKVAALEGS
tara:strand:- start:461 stop:1633 length:1173 start_codon:yes stop_codon:yes gene_type:complete